MKCLLFVLMVAGLAVSQKSISWKELKDVVIDMKTDPKTAMVSYYSTFGDQIKKLGNKEVAIAGYIIPVNLSKNLYAISQYPFQSCFFCTGDAGPETVMMLDLKQKDQQLSIDDFKIVRGTLVLNDSDPSQLAYILKDAIVEIL